MAHTFTDLLYHIVFSTKNRASLIDDELRPELWKYLGGIVKGFKGEPIIIGGVADHSHLLIALPPTICVSDALRLIKTNSSGWVHESFPTRHRFAWQAGYAAFTLSESRRDTVIRYIRNQEQHHRKVSFQDEFMRLLKKHRIDYDPATLWE